MSEADQLERDLEHDRDHLRETLGAIEEKMSPGRLLDEAMAHFNTGPRAFAGDLASQIRDKPMPALLTGIGLAWLMMSPGKGGAEPSGRSETAANSGSGYAMEPTDYHAWDEHDRLQQAEWACVRSESETPEAHAERLDQVRAAALGLTYDPTEDRESFSTRVRSAADGVKQKGASARARLKQAAAAVSHGTTSAAGHAGHGARAAVQGAADGARSTIASGLQLHEKNPVATAAFGVALGALLGAAIPLTRKEEGALAGLADHGLAMGADLSRKAADAVADRAGNADRPGPDPDAATASL